MKYLRKFNESISQVTDFEEIKMKLKSAENLFFSEYSLELTPDGRVVYNGDLKMNQEILDLVGGEGTKHFPLKIDEVTGSMFRGSLRVMAKITTLEGFPKYVNGSLECRGTLLSSLVGCPQKIGGTFYMETRSNIKTLEGGPMIVGGNYDVSEIGLESLVGAPRVVHWDFECIENNITDLVGAPEEVGRDFICSINEKLTSLRGCPKRIGGDFILNLCPNLWDPTGLRDCEIDGQLSLDDYLSLSRVINLFPTVKDFQNSLDYNYIKGPDRIDLFKFREALDELDINYIDMMRKRFEAMDFISIGKYKFVDQEGRYVNFDGKLIK